jgi:hypothetical protein
MEVELHAFLPSAMGEEKQPLIKMNMKGKVLSCPCAK